MSSSLSLLLTAALGVSGCGTIATQAIPEEICDFAAHHQDRCGCRNISRIYSGVQAGLCEAGSGTELQLYAFLDLPLSLAGDTLLLPVTAYQQAKHGDLCEHDLHYAASVGPLEVVESLLAAGADPNIRNESGSTPLINASRKGHIEIVRLLIANGADLELRSKWDGMTALWSAASYGPSDRRLRAEVVQVLVQAGADVNTTAFTRMQSPILIFPVAQGHFETVYVLLEAGADPHASDSAGDSAMARAKEIGNADMIKLLEGKRPR